MKCLKLSTLLISTLCIIFTAYIFLYPIEVVNAAKYGIQIWFNNLFPSLFPFLIVSSILTSVGAVSFVGILLEPLMSPIFRLSGKAAFPFILGNITGFPVGAKITSDLRIKKELSQTDAMQTMSMCNNSSPLFILGTVSLGMLKNPQYGYFLMLITYLSVISTGILFRFMSPKIKQHKSLKNSITQNKNKPTISFNNQTSTNSKSIGEILGNSVIDGMEIISKVGGFVILFSVVSTILKLSPIMPLAEALLKPLLNVLKLDANLCQGIIMGIIEITNGIDMITSCNAPIKQQLIVIACLISWCGFSVHTQIISVCTKSDIKTAPYMLAKIVQAIFALIYSAIIFQIFI